MCFFIVIHAHVTVRHKRPCMLKKIEAVRIAHIINFLKVILQEKEGLHSFFRRKHCAASILSEVTFES